MLHAAKSVVVCTIFILFILIPDSVVAQNCTPSLVACSVDCGGVTAWGGQMYNPCGALGPCNATCPAAPAATTAPVATQAPASSDREGETCRDVLYGDCSIAGCSNPARYCNTCGSCSACFCQDRPTPTPGSGGTPPTPTIRIETPVDPGSVTCRSGIYYTCRAQCPTDTGTDPLSLTLGRQCYDPQGALGPCEVDCAAAHDIDASKTKRYCKGYPEGMSDNEACRPGQRRFDECEIFEYNSYGTELRLYNSTCSECGDMVVSWCTYGRPSPTPTSSCGQKRSGDANCDARVNDDDLYIWKSEFLQVGVAAVVTSRLESDFDGDGRVTLTDYEVWRRSTYL